MPWIELLLNRQGRDEAETSGVFSVVIAGHFGPENSLRYHEDVLSMVEIEGATTRELVTRRVRNWKQHTRGVA